MWKSHSQEVDSLLRGEEISKALLPYKRVCPSEINQKNVELKVKPRQLFLR